MSYKDMYRYRYMKLCSMLGEYSKTGVKKHNKGMDGLTKLFYKLSENKAIAGVLLTELMDLEDENIRLIAASHSLGMNLNLTKAQTTLNDIFLSSNKPLSRLNAEMALKTWEEQGFLRF